MPLVYISLAAVVVSVGIYIGLQVAINSQANSLVEHIQQTSRAQATTEEGGE
jgi:type VI protein secretion system component VasF